MPVFSVFSHENHDKEIADLSDETLALYPELSSTQLHVKERNAIEQTVRILKLSKSLLSDLSGWKTEKPKDGIELFTRRSPQLDDIKLFMFRVNLDVSLDTVLADLLDFPANPTWNRTCEECSVPVTFPAGFWVTYTRMSDYVSRMIAKRDFTTCCTKEQTESQCYYVGTACDIPQCPPRDHCVRGEQKMLAVRIDRESGNSCTLSQITSINFKGWIPQAVVDGSMLVSLASYAKCLKQRTLFLKDRTSQAPTRDCVQN